MTTEAPSELTTDQISALSPEMARELLGQMQQKYLIENASGKAMTPAEATAKLAEMDLAARPLAADGKPIPKPPITSIVSSDELLARNVAQTFTDLEERGFPARGTPVGDDLHAMMEGRTPVTPEVEKAVRAKHAQCTTDQEWNKRLLQGHQETTRQFHIMSAIIAAAEIQRGEF